MDLGGLGVLDQASWHRLARDDRSDDQDRAGHRAVATGTPGASTESELVLVAKHSGRRIASNERRPS
jgi:hypothetical protein